MVLTVSLLLTVVFYVSVTCACMYAHMHEFTLYACTYSQNFVLQSQLCVLTLIWCPFHPHVTAVACKRPQSFCQKCRWQVTPKHAYTLDPFKSEWADNAAVQAECGNLSGNEPTCNSSGNTQSQSSQLAEALWTDSGLKSGISLRELIST